MSEVAAEVAYTLTAEQRQIVDHYAGRLQALESQAAAVRDTLNHLLYMACPQPDLRYDPGAGALTRPAGEIDHAECKSELAEVEVG